MHQRGTETTARGAAGEGLAWLLATLASAAAGEWVVRASGFQARSIVARGFGPPWAAVMIGLALAAYLLEYKIAVPGQARLGIAVLAGAATGMVMMPLLAGLHGTAQPQMTILRGDMAFRTEYVTRLASSWRLRDFTLRGLGGFYPPAWFWLAGRTAHLLGVVPWRIVKPFTIGTIGAALALAFLLWRQVLSPAAALAAAIGSSLVLPSQVGPVQHASLAWYEPYSAFVAITGVAWLAVAVRVARRPEPGRWSIALLAVAGVVLALSYYLLFVILVVALVALVVVSGDVRRRAAGRAAWLCGGVALLTAPFWIPLVGIVLGGSAAQGHYVTPAFFRVVTGFGRPPALTLLAALSIGLLVLTWRRAASQAIVVLLAVLVVYQLVSVVTLVVVHQQLQPHRAVAMLWAAYGAAVPVAFAGLRRRREPLGRLLQPAAAGVAALAVFALGSGLGADLAAGRLTRAAHVRVDLRPTTAISRFITRSEGLPPERLTVLSADTALLVTRPYWSFLPLRARYANPQARLPQRVATLRRAAACRRPACLARRLRRTPFGAVDALVLLRTFSGLQVPTQLDAFPDPLRGVLRFRPALLSGRYWIRRDIGPYAAFVMRRRPLPAGAPVRPGDGGPARDPAAGLLR